MAGRDQVHERLCYFFNISRCTKFGNLVTISQATHSASAPHVMVVWSFFTPALHPVGRSRAILTQGFVFSSVLSKNADTALCVTAASIHVFSNRVSPNYSIVWRYVLLLIWNVVNYRHDEEKRRPMKTVAVSWFLIRTRCFLIGNAYALPVWKQVNWEETYVFVSLLKIVVLLEWFVNDTII
jgi:hypothetical protein